MPNERRLTTYNSSARLDMNNDLLSIGAKSSVESRTWHIKMKSRSVNGAFSNGRDRNRIANSPDEQRRSPPLR